MKTKMTMRELVDQLDALSLVTMRSDTIGSCDRIIEGKTCVMRQRSMDATDPDKLCDPCACYYFVQRATEVARRLHSYQKAQNNG